VRAYTWNYKLTKINEVWGIVGSQVKSYKLLISRLAKAKLPCPTGVSAGRLSDWSSRRASARLVGRTLNEIYIHSEINRVAQYLYS